MEEIMKSVQILCETGQVYELRCPKTERGTVAGYFDNLRDLAYTAESLSGTVPAVYITLNPVLPDLLARSNNSHKYRMQHTTADHEIVKRTRLLIDCDPIRPAGISSTDQEHDAAIQMIQDIREFLTTEGFPKPLVGDSSNGGHLVYGIALSNDKESADLLKRFLEALACRFDDKAVTVDRTVWNAARISKIYGTKSMKGDPTPTRPHRLSRIIESPDQLETVPVELLRQVAEMTTKGKVNSTAQLSPTPKKSARPGMYQAADVEKMMKERRLKFRPGQNYKGGTRWELEECPWGEEHTAVFSWQLSLQT